MNAHAITIINSYKDHPEFTELPGVDRDQSTMCAFLEDLGYDVTVLRDRRRESILAELDRVVDRLKPGGRLVIYYSGHGETILNRETLICPEARVRYLDQLDGVITLELLRLRTESRGLQRLLINDSCRSNRYRSHKGSAPSFRGTANVKDIVALAQQEVAQNNIPSTFTILNGCSEDQFALDLGPTVGGLCTAALRRLARQFQSQSTPLQIDQDFVYTHLAAEMKRLAADHGHGFCPSPWLCGPVFKLADVVVKAEAPRVAVPSPKIVVLEPKPEVVVHPASAKLRLLSQPRKLHTLEGHTNVVHAASFSPDGRWVVTGSDDETARLWDAQTGQLLRTLKGHIGEVTAASYSPDGRQVLTMSKDGTAGLWDAQTGRQLDTLGGHTGEVTAASFSPDGRQVLTGSELDDTVHLWDADPNSQTYGQLLHSLGHGLMSVWIASFSPDGKRVVTVCCDYTAHLWDAQTGYELRTLEGHTDDLIDASFSPDGRQVLTKSEDGTARLWDAQTGKPLRTLEGHTDDLIGASFSPDGRQVLTRSEDSTARLWDAQTGKLLHTLEGHTGEVTAASFSPDGRQVLTGSNDRTARLWDADLQSATFGQELASIDAGQSVGYAAFSPDGLRIVVSVGTVEAQIWQVAE